MKKISPKYANFLNLCQSCFKMQHFKLEFFSLKKTAVVLQEHEEALQNKNDAQIELGEREK